MGRGLDQPGYVFTAEDGYPLHPERIKVKFGELVAEAGVRRIRFHDLRHTSATLALAAGIHPKVVSERLGHSSIGITLDLYSHVTPSLQAEAAEKLGAVLLGRRMSVAQPSSASIARTGTTCVSRGAGSAGPPRAISSYACAREMPRR